jgi:metal-dependent hydrolase (beta-lactamase superfamily II)
VIGGFHLVPPLSDDYIHQVIGALKEIGPDYLVLEHVPPQLNRGDSREAKDRRVYRH